MPTEFPPTEMAFLRLPAPLVEQAAAFMQARTVSFWGHHDEHMHRSDRAVHPLALPLHSTFHLSNCN